MKVEISITHRQRILDHARSSRTEVCGLLLGDGERITEVERCANVSSEPATRFELDPVAFIAAWRAARTGGLQVIGHYHSHPTGDPRPSLTDAADAAPDGALWIIVGASEMAAWRAVERGALHGRFDPVELIVTAG